MSHYPIFAYIEPTLYCNLRCPACPTGLRLNLRPKATIDLDYYAAVLDEVGQYLFELYLYNWGEPLLFPHTPQMIRMAANYGIRTTLSSNLSLNLSDDYLHDLTDSGLSRIIVSLDGTSADTYEHYRRKGQFDLVRENMRRLRDIRDAGGSSLEIVCQFLVFRHNEHEIETIQQVYQAWGADTLIIEGAQMPHEPYATGYEPSTIPRYNIYLKQTDPYPRACSWLYGGMVLNPNGSVSPCCSSPAQNDDFAQHDGDWLTAWNSDKFQQARGLTDGQEASNTLINGMGTAAHQSVVGEELICHQCPIPFRQDEADRIIARVLWQTLKSVRRNPLNLLLILLMGGPNRYILRRIWNGFIRKRNRI